MRVRLLLAAGLLVLLAGPARADEPGAGGPSDDDPGLITTAPTPSAAPAAKPTPEGTGAFGRRERGPRLQLSWSTFSIADQGNRTARYHLFDLHGYYLAGILRAGAGLEGGVDSTPRANGYGGAVLSVGVQRPARLTPSLDFRLGFGVLVQDVLEERKACFAWHVGIEGGLTVFAHRWFFLTAAIGWRHQGVRQPGDTIVQPFNLYYDSFTARVGIGF